MKQKHLCLFLLASVLMLAGCTKEPIPNNTGNNGGGNGGINVNVPSQASVKVGQTYNLGSAQSWSSSNTFVATVASNGIITGQHVGNCTVSCPYGSCRVTVSATINLFRDPITQWGMSKTQVISQEGYDYEETSGGAIGYQTGNTIAPVLMYTFQNNKLKTASIMVKNTYTSQVVDHLKERYRYLGYEGGAYYFADGVSSSDSKTAVVLQYLNTSYWAVHYAEHP